MAEHRVYFASTGLFASLASVALRIGSSTGTQRTRAGYALLLAGILGLLSTATLARNHTWDSPVAIWRQAVTRAPGMWEPHYALGDALREAGDCAAAVPEYDAALRLYPTHRDARTNLGICLAQTGRLDEAEMAFRRALELDPAFARAHTNLGGLAQIRGEPEAARNHYLEAIRIDPTNVVARLQLAGLYENTFHDYGAALGMCREARALAPSAPRVAECVVRLEKLVAGGRSR
jgi:tetratricopeptide (TPR) repeat protein